MRPLIDKLKDLATAPDNIIEKKGDEPINNPYYIDINMTTNNDNSTDIQKDDHSICRLNLVRVILEMLNISIIGGMLQ